jgi:Tfp pilus assembly protein FimT
MWGAMRGLSFLEIMITITIITATLAIATMSIFGRNHKQGLTDTMIGLEDTLRRAQSEADRNREIRGVCFKQDSAGQQFAQIYEPSLGGNRLPTNLDCDNTDSALGYRFAFKTGVTLCTSCDANVSLSKSLFFNPQGFSILSNGTPTNFEICLVQTKLPSGNRAREIELNSLGVIKLLSSGETGSFSGVVANSGNCL